MATSGATAALDELQQGQRGIVLCAWKFKRLMGHLRAYDIVDVYILWFRKKGRAVEKQLLAAAQAKAPTQLQPKVNQSRFQDVIRQAFKEEEDDEPELLELCKAVLEDEEEIPSADAFIAVHRILGDTGTFRQTCIPSEALQLLLSDGPGGADELTASIGFPEAAPMVKKMVGDLLEP